MNFAKRVRLRIRSNTVIWAYFVGGADEPAPAGCGDVGCAAARRQPRPRRRAQTPSPGTRPRLRPADRHVRLSIPVLALEDLSPRADARQENSAPGRSQYRHGPAVDAQSVALA